MTTENRTEQTTSSATHESDAAVDSVVGGDSGRKRDEPLIRVLHRLIGFAIRILAVMMVGVIFFGVIDVAYVLYQRILAPPVGLLTINDILATFGAFMAVLIAIEIFHNIELYLRSDVIHVKVVLATALMAIARKIIVLDFKDTAPIYVFAIAASVLAIGIVYWLIVGKGEAPHYGKSQATE